MSFKKNIVLVEWMDSLSPKTIWHHEEDLKKYDKRTDTMYSIGYFIKENKDEIVLCSCLHDNGKDIHGYGNLFIIPKGAIIKKTKLKA